MKKVVRLTESDLIKIVKRVIKEEDSPKEKGKDLYTLLHSLRNSINDEDKKEALSKLEDVFSIVRDMEDKPKSKRDVNEQDKVPASVNKLEKAIQMPKAKPPEGRNKTQWITLVGTLKDLKYKPYILPFTSYDNIPSESLNWGRASKLSGGRGNYGLVISSTDSKSPKEQIQLFDTENKGNQMGMHRWWQSKGYETNGREIKIKFSDAGKLKQDIELFFTKYPPVRDK